MVIDTSSSYEEARANLTKLNEWYKKGSRNNMNEADTRFFLINDLFLKCLGWNKDDVRNEEAQGTEYADYTFYANSRRSMIVEAKRESIGFELPAGFNKTEYKISSLSRDNPGISDAITQAMGYCGNRGVDIAVVANGYQLIAFLARRGDGVNPLNGKAIVFSSIDKMEDNFFQLWQCLSKPAVVEKRITFQLQDTEVSILPLKLSAVTNNYPRVARRNELQTSLQIVGEVILENVNKNEEVIDDFLRETYCSSGALSQYALVSKSILSNRYSLLFEESTIAPNVTDAITKKGLSNDIFAESLSLKPILLLGDVGAGKSMFINYFMRIEANEVIKKSYTLYIDLGSKAALENDLKQFFQKEIIRIFSEKHGLDLYQDEFVRGVYHGPILQFQKSIYGRLRETAPADYLKEEIKFLAEKINDRTEHLKQCFLHITKARRRQIIIFMDNVDQRDDHIQEDAFFIANEIASNWPAVVFVTLRPSTYTKSKRIGALTGYHPKAFRISPPRISEVISKRLPFALKIASGELVAENLSSGLGLKLQTLSQFIEILIYSFRFNKSLIEFVDNVCAGNVRKAIEYLTIFIGSGHIDTEKILNKDLANHSEGNRYTVALHEFIRAILYREHSDYFPEETDIVNVFEISQEGKEHFILPIFLDYLLRYSQQGQDGFIHTTVLTQFLQDEGFTVNQVEFAILRAVYRGLIETEGRKILNIGDPLPQACRITTTGSYHLQRLLKMFVYFDAVLIDTPITKQEYRALVKDAFSIYDRLDRAEIFRQYLDAIWAEAKFTYKGFSWVDLSKDLQADVKLIRSRLG